MSDQSRIEPGTVFALAGRRIDAEEADAPRFPLARATAVRDRLTSLFAARQALALVCSAACGADLLALEAALALGIRRRVVLPVGPARFRATSVVDRPGDWGPRFDRILAAAQTAGDLIVLPGSEDAASYAAANAAIVREALVIVPPPRHLAAVTVWEGAARGEDDLTEDFRRLAVQAGFEHLPILTL